jgi:NADPH-dependent 7-cyano-7-deazaguanine reductase QueF
VRAADPLRAEVVGDFTPRGGISTKITRVWKRSRTRSAR